MGIKKFLYKRGIPLIKHGSLPLPFLHHIGRCEGLWNTPLNWFDKIIFNLGHGKVLPSFWDDEFIGIICQSSLDLMTIKVQ